MEVSLKCVKPEKDGCCSNSPGNQHSLSGGREDGDGVPHSHLIYQLRPSAVYLLFWFSNVGHFLFPKSCFVFPRLSFVFPMSCYIFPKSCHYGWCSLIRHLTEYLFFPKTDSGPILRDCVKYKCALRLHILSFPSLYPRASLGDDKQLKWNFYAPRPPHTARPAHPKWSR